mmetsp:Transcript_53701/g.123055  ORF Transcript_53701/g.123055 Transcript_53701/m.123055 type:complete len:230 (+) Transcript_53701:7245-7934(+)
MSWAIRKSPPDCSASRVHHPSPRAPSAVRAPRSTGSAVAQAGARKRWRRVLAAVVVGRKTARRRALSPAPARLVNPAVASPANRSTRITSPTHGPNPACCGYARSNSSRRVAPPWARGSTRLITARVAVAPALRSSTRVAPGALRNTAWAVTEGSPGPTANRATARASLETTLDTKAGAVRAVLRCAIFNPATHMPRPASVWASSSTPTIAWLITHVAIVGHRFRAWHR